SVNDTLLSVKESLALASRFKYSGMTARGNPGFAKNPAPASACLKKSLAVFVGLENHPVAEEYGAPSSRTPLTTTHCNASARSSRFVLGSFSVMSCQHISRSATSWPTSHACAPFQFVASRQCFGIVTDWPSNSKINSGWPAFNKSDGTFWWHATQVFARTY